MVYHLPTAILFISRHNRRYADPREHTHDRTHSIQTRPAIKELCEHYHVRRLALFGSAVSGAFDSRTSDLDFVVDFEHTDSMNMADQYFGLSEGLQKLFQRRIDLVTERSIRNPYFKNAVDQTRTLLYAA